MLLTDVNSWIFNMLCKIPFDSAFFEASSFSSFSMFTLAKHKNARQYLLDKAS